MEPQVADGTVPADVSPGSLIKDPRCLLAFGLGSGLTPAAPGTFGTLAAIPLYLLIQPLAGMTYGLLVVLLFVVGIALCGTAARRLGVHDHPAIVWDEVVGYLLTMAAAPPGWGWVAVGFLLFRLFDITKPWPIRWVDRRVHGGFGIMLDDALAALPAWLLLQALAHWL